MSDKLPTALEFAFENMRGTLTFEEISFKLIEFAQLHVTEALEAAAHQATTYSDVGGYTFVDTESILSSYPLENIK